MLRKAGGRPRGHLLSAMVIEAVVVYILGSCSVVVWAVDMERGEWDRLNGVSLWTPNI